VSTQPQSSSRQPRVQTGSALIVVLVLALAAMLVLPATALGQPTGPTPTPAPAASPTAATQPTTQAGPALNLSSSNGEPGANITANGAGFDPGAVVEVRYNGQVIDSPTANTVGAFSVVFAIPAGAPGQYVVAANEINSPKSATANFTVNKSAASLSLSVPQGAPGTQLAVGIVGFQPGEAIKVSFNGATVGTATADTSGAATVSFSIPTLSPAPYVVTASGQTTPDVNATFTVLAGAAAAATAAPTATPVPAAAPAPNPAAAANAPAVVHDDRYFTQTGYRIDDDQVWAFFQQYKGVDTFGYPVSRSMSLLGCPVQMFQRQIIQVCPGSGAALINMLDPEIFPYTMVNNSTFPAADTTMKNNTPQVGSPTYSTDISNFIEQNVPDMFAGQPVNFQQTFNNLGGLTIWGAPISHPQPDPTNANFIYQRFQRGIMHYTVGQGTESILLADYLKAIMMNQNVPTDLLAQARETRFFNQYCPGNALWLCRPSELPGTDLTYAFVNG
jgi:hypothetical protein